MLTRRAWLNGTKLYVRDYLDEYLRRSPTIERRYEPAMNAELPTQSDAAASTCQSDPP